MLNKNFFLLLCIILFLNGCASIGNSTGKNSSQDSAQTLKVKNGKLQYVRFGHGKTIILINGYIADLGSWDQRFLNVLAQQHDVIMMNNPGVGQSQVNTPVYNTNALAKDVHELATGLHVHKPIILGYSMGGLVAQQYAVNYPHDIDKLILMSTFIAGREAKPLSPEMRRQLLNFPSNPINRFLMATKVFFPKGWRLRAAEALILHRYVPQGYPFDDFPPEATRKAQINLMYRWHNDNRMSQEINKINVPTLIISGADDTVVPTANSDILARHIPHAQVARWADAGHALTFQYPVAIANRINAFAK